MWPKPGSGTPAPEWVGQGAGGFYALHTDFPTLTGAVGIPGATPGIMAPYQERPQVHPLELHLTVEAGSAGRFFPLLMAVGRDAGLATTAALGADLARQAAGLPKLYQEHVARLEAQRAEQTSIVTPDQALNADFGWAGAFDRAVAGAGFFGRGGAGGGVLCFGRFGAAGVRVVLRQGHAVYAVCGELVWGLWVVAGGDGVSAEAAAGGRQDDARVLADGGRVEAAGGLGFVSVRVCGGGMRLRCF